MIGGLIAFTLMIGVIVGYWAFLNYVKGRWWEGE